MLSYQHGYHAGNLADIHKHITLVCLLDTLMSKPRGLSLIDTHAGRGIYPLDDEFAQKTGEQAEGIGQYQGGAKVLDAAITMAETKFGQGHYFGSPALMAALKREQDRLILSELHPQEYAALKANLSRDAEIHKRDGLEMAEAISPPKPRRGLVLIDPSYEIKSEYAAIPKSVGRILRKWPQAVIAIWYPILKGDPHLALTEKLQTVGEVKSEVAFTSSKMRMRGSGMLVLNAPFGFENTLRQELQNAKLF